MRPDGIWRTAFLLATILWTSPCAAQQRENPMLHLRVPSGLEKGQGYFSFGHTFYRALNHYPKNDFFAVLNGGANLDLNLRMMIAYGFEANAGYISRAMEKTIGLSKTLTVLNGKILTRMDVQYFNYKDFVHDNTDRNFFYAWSLQTMPLFSDRLVATVNAAYDGYNESVGTGFGLSWAVLKRVSMIGEFYPLSENSETADRGCFAAGLKIATYGHQFLFRISNTDEMGTRRYMTGTGSNQIYLGFTVMRLIGE